MSRLINWNYSSSGFYFITICTYNKNKFLGKIIDGEAKLSKSGKIVRQELFKTFKIRKNIELDEWIIMPNHIHLIIQIKLHNSRDVARYVSTEKQSMTKISPNPNTLSSIIRSFKSAVKKECNCQHLSFSWQSRFYDRIIRNEKEYYNIKQYIKDNPKNWEKDPNYK